VATRGVREGGEGAPARRYTEAEAARTGVLLANGYSLIETLFGSGLSRTVN
jgi:hypothetical protein